MTKEKFKEIFDEYFDPVRSYIYYRCGDPELATDITQEAFLRIWEKQIETIPGKTKALLFKIAGDLFISKYRRQKIEQQFIVNFTPDNTASTPEEEIEFQELQIKYKTALAALPEKQRVVFMMSRMEKLKYSEIADSLGISVKAVEKRMKLALDFFRKMLINK